MITITNLTAVEKYTNREIFKELNLCLSGKHTAIIGEEGNGKSTLLKLIVGKELNYLDLSGEIHADKKVGYLEQNIKELYVNTNVIDYLLFENNKMYYELYGNIKKVLNKVKLSSSSFIEDKKLGEFSGGECTKIALAKLLLHNNDILLLDEPSNDLDFETILFLEDFINDSDKEILYVSHDTRLLKNTADSILHIARINRKTIPKIYYKNVGYEEYLKETNIINKKQLATAKRERKEFKIKQEKVRKIYDSVRNAQDNCVRDPISGRLLAKKMKNVKAQMGRLNKTSFTDFPPKVEEINITFETKKIVDKRLLTLDTDVLGTRIKLEVDSKDKLVIVGKNGIGKTTLLNKIAEIFNENNVDFFYLSQNYMNNLDYEKTILENLTNSLKKEDLTKIKKILGNLLFTSYEMNHKVKNLSPGMIMKVLIVKMMLLNPDVLLLDEPTRNLSPLTMNGFYNFIDSFSGAIICVSHDRDFIENCFDKIYLFKKNNFFLNYL